MAKRGKNPERLKPIPPDQLREKFGEILKDLPGAAFHGPGAPTNVFGTIAYRPEIAHLFLPYWVKSKKLLELSMVEQEMIILRMAFLFRSDYVWAHHTRLIKEAGVTDDVIAKIAMPLKQAAWDEKNGALLRVVDDLVKKANVRKKDWKDLMKFYKKEQVLDIITVVSQYVFFCCVNNVFGVKIEDPSLPLVPG